MKKVIISLVLGLVLVSPLHASVASDVAGLEFNRFLATRNGAPFDFSKLDIDTREYGDAVVAYNTKCVTVNEQYKKDLAETYSGSYTMEQAGPFRAALEQKYWLLQEPCSITFDNLMQIIHGVINAQKLAQPAPTVVIAQPVQVQDDPETIKLLMQIIELLKLQIAALIAQQTQ